MKQKNPSKFLSLVLRHNPELIGIKIDKQGWANVDELINKTNKYGQVLTIDELKIIVKDNDKQRFSFNDDMTKIKANQGHSINIQLSLEAIEPPEFLFHGTTYKFMSAIRLEGLKKMSRNHVHLSNNIFTATNVGQRHGLPVILTVKSGEMFKDGFLFYLSENKVWLADHVPVKYIVLK